jgi:hypothetical protein
MKKFINILSCLIVAMVAMSFTAKAQEVGDVLMRDTWFSVQMSGDELTDRTEQEVIAFNTSDGDYLITYSSRPNILIITSKNGSFDFDRSSMRIIIGYYNENNELVKKETPYFFKLGSYSSGYTGGEDGKSLMQFIKTQKGYVRIVIDRYLSSDFDVKFPTWVSTPPTKTNRTID